MKDGVATYKYQNEISDHLLANVLKMVLIKPWPKNFHKMIATKLGIQNNLAKRCINKLIEDKKI